MGDGDDSAEGRAALSGAMVPLSLTRTPERLVQTAEKGRAETGQIADATAIEAKTSERIMDLSRAVRGRPDNRVSLSRALRQRSLKSR